MRSIVRHEQEELRPLRDVDVPRGGVRAALRDVDLEGGPAGDQAVQVDRGGDLVVP